ncbi:MAG TPA: DUF3662 domain-containing protein [Pyrinomonadaceae bacterium]|nr:DUF3662 domain-containing protein [Pyrinomonadaceae bacterium]
MDKDLTGKLQEVLLKCQAWIDDEKYVPKPFRIKSQSDEFAEKIMSALEDEMINQKFGFQNHKIYLPTKYSIQISPEDSREFVGKKREILVQELNRFVERCLRMLSVETNNNIFVQLFSCAELEKDEIKINHQWEESYEPNIRFNSKTDFTEDTIIAPAFWEDEETVVSKRLKQLYCVNILHRGVWQNSFPVFQPEISIGRGSPSFPVDLKLNDDLEISRQHAILTYQSGDSFSLSVVGQNPVKIGENFISAGQTANLNWEDHFQIGNYVLNVQR